VLRILRAKPISLHAECAKVCLVWLCVVPLRDGSVLLKCVKKRCVLVCAPGLVSLDFTQLSFSQRRGACKLTCKHGCCYGVVCAGVGRGEQRCDTACTSILYLGVNICIASHFMTTVHVD
jgi:hypothetical protein